MIQFGWKEYALVALAFQSPHNLIIYDYLIF